MWLFIAKYVDILIMVVLLAFCVLVHFENCSDLRTELLERILKSLQFERIHSVS